MTRYLIIFLILPINCIWPPLYDINLGHQETFVIDEPFEKSDLQDIYDEEELIKTEEKVELKQAEEARKYYRLHQSIKNSNSVITHGVKKKQVYEEFNPDKDELVPWKAGLVDENGDFKDEDVIYFNEIKEKRESKSIEIENNADYLRLQSEYQKTLTKAKETNSTLNFNETKEDESLRDDIKKLLKLKDMKNCSQEDMNGIGLTAIKCTLSSIKQPKLQNRSLEKFLRILLVWLSVYLIIAVPLWCQYGWCCCCCRCKFCRPREEIDEIKKFFAENPVGMYHDKDGEQLEYTATYYERYAQKKLERELQRL